MPEATTNTNTVIPADHAFFDFSTFVTVKAKEMAIEILNKGQSRCPDAFDMYIYNDFYSYAIFDLVDKTLGTLNTKIKKKDWKEAFVVLEALMLFINCEGDWTQCDDGQRVRYTNKAIGAAALAVFQGLEKSADFKVSSYPSLESLLHNCVKTCAEGMMCSKKYEPIFRGIARRLYAGKTEADFTREHKMLEEWVSELDSNDEVDEEDEDDDEDDDAEPRGKEAMQNTLKKRAEERAAAVAAGKPINSWFATGDIVTKIPNELKYTRTWKDYREYLSGCPSLPLKGPPKWDLTTWTAAEKKPFQFNFGDDGNSD